MAKTEYGLLLDQILGHPGERINQHLSSHDISKQMLWGNYQQLRSYIQSLEDPVIGEKIFDSITHPSPVYIEINRLFHNFVTSAKTLVDHTRVLLDKEWIIPEHKNKSCDEIKQRFAEDITVSFVHDLRNYLNHYTIPVVEISKHKVGTLPPKIAVKFNLEEMAKWGEWKSRSREFLRTQSKECRILAVVEAYHEKVRSFHDGFNQPFHSYYKSELSEVQAMWTRFSGGAGK